MAFDKAASSVPEAHLLLKYAFCVWMVCLLPWWQGDYTN